MTTTETAPSSGTAVRGGSVALAGQAAKMLLQITGLIVLSRMIGPAEFGLVAMVMAVLGVAEVFRDLGLSSAAIQADVLTRGQKNNLFWINTSLGLVLSVAGSAAALGIAAFYDEPRLVPIAVVLSTTFLLNGLQTQFMAELARNLRFVALAVSDIASAATALALAVVIALLGWGYWALVVQIVVQALMCLIIRSAVAHWRPGWVSRSDSVRGLMRYGWNLMLTQTLVYVSSNLDKILIGSRFNAATLGLYTRAMQIVVLPTSQLFGPATNVALPVLSRLQSQPQRFGALVLTAQLSLGYPVVLGLAAAVAVADPVLPMIMGQQWAPAVPLFRLLAASALFQVVNYVIYWIFLAQGRTGSHFRYSLVARSILIVAIIVGATFGVEGVAAGFLVGTIIPWPIALLWIRSWSLAPARTMFFNGMRVIVAGLLLGAAGLLTSMMAADGGVVFRVVTPLSAVAAACGLLALFPGYRSDVATVLRATHHLRRPGRRSDESDIQS